MPRKKAPETAVDGTPIWARNAKGQPICGVVRKGKTCSACVALMGNGRCRKHAGAGANRTKSDLLAIRTREEFQKHLGGDGLVATRLINKLKDLALGENSSLEALKYCLDQLFGGPKTTIVTEIAEPKVIDAASEAAMEVEQYFEQPGLFDKWLELFKAKIGSGSTT